MARSNDRVSIQRVIIVAHGLPALPCPPHSVHLLNIQTKKGTEEGTKNTEEREEVRGGEQYKREKERQSGARFGGGEKGREDSYKTASPQDMKRMRNRGQ